MKLAKPNCPTCGKPARGTLDTIYGVALLAEPDKDGQTDYIGETDVNWDSQRPVDDPEGITLECQEGHQWVSSCEDWSDAPAEEEQQ
jgi:hypothetical protein